MTEKKSAERIDLGTDPSLVWDMRRAAYRLTYLLGYTPQYAEVLQAVKEFANAVIKVTDEQQKCYADVERISRDIIRRVREKEKEEEKDLPVIGRPEEISGYVKIPTYKDHMTHVVTKEEEE